MATEHCIFESPYLLQYQPYLCVLGVILKPMSPSFMVDFHTEHPFCVLSYK